MTTKIASRGHGQPGPPPGYHVASRGVGHNQNDDGYIDSVAVERAVAGDPPARLYTGEIRAAVVILTGLGFGTADIARRIGVADRTVNRHRARLRTENAA